VIFTSDKKQMDGYWLNQYFPEAMRRSTAKMPAVEEVCLALETAGFENLVSEKYYVRPGLQDCFMYCGKQEPRMYFDPVVRKGSSGFAIYSDEEEVERVLEGLSRDIASGRINEVIESYRNEDGDYLFIAAERTSP
jgi:hypothetical protein